MPWNIMAGALRQLDSLGRRFLNPDGKRILGGIFDPCCCSGSSPSGPCPCPYTMDDRPNPFLATWTDTTISDFFGNNIFIPASSALIYGQSEVCVWAVREVDESSDLFGATNNGAPLVRGACGVVAISLTVFLTSFACPSGCAWGAAWEISGLPNLVNGGCRPDDMVGYLWDYIVGYPPGTYNAVPGCYGDYSIIGVSGTVTVS